MLATHCGHVNNVGWTTTAWESACRLRCFSTSFAVSQACRSAERAQAAIQSLEAEFAGAAHGPIEFMPLDLSSLASVRAFSLAFRAKGLPLHLLIDNAGIMLVPFNLTVDGFESTMVRAV